MMDDNMLTERLALKKLTIDDLEFVYELVNTPGWIEFIGDRHIHSTDDAMRYIGKVLNNQDITYWVVRLRSDSSSIGIVTFIKRDYLDHYDIGFAFLPSYANMGYAYEASKYILENLLRDPLYPVILAATKPDNKKSISLLERLGLTLQYEKEIADEKLLIFSSAT